MRHDDLKEKKEKLQQVEFRVTAFYLFIYITVRERTVGQSKKKSISNWRYTTNFHILLKNNLIANH
jgi:hypothetical protein